MELRKAMGKTTGRLRNVGNGRSQKQIAQDIALGYLLLAFQAVPKIENRKNGQWSIGSKFPRSHSGLRPST